ncbi:MAG: pyrroloquinoline quinone biosynthesis peptide chaperone PqqD [Gammaproteobacteria bacterium]|nr:pyrroloquinoline quinone biosynthesis peptide chaperone PqqD [Gammaproteobacteria bacterium]MBI5617259.1 pyrroloquinoline quinone biosynthesis peptide chaperone PqqD [Gammaproteobacteria bacterium]
MSPEALQAVAPQTIPKIAPMFRLQWEDAQDAHVLLYPEGMVKLGASAGEILKRCNGRLDVAGIIAELKAQYPGADLEADVYRFLEVAYAQGWLRSVG